MKRSLFLSLLLALSLTCLAGGKKGSFTVGTNTFLLNGKPFTVKAAEIHYPRIPRDYWDHRIKMCKALGMNTVCIYIFWNIHEPQENSFDFSANNDIAEFCRVAQKNGMYVIVRPGPYVCAEWEMGGLPWWLLKHKDIRLREQDPYFMERVGIFERKVAEQLSPLTIQNGGPVIMIQVENEYGSYGKDKPYVSAIRDELRKCYGDEITLFQCDWASNFQNNALDDLLWTMNFGTGANIDDQFRTLKQLRPTTPLMCSEFWSGWFDKWGGKHETRSAKDMVAGLKEMLEKNISFSLYMTHGGTSFGHWAGANSPGFAPDVTSYDYDAPINEYGQPTEKYWQLRSMLQEFSKKKLPTPPEAPMPIISIPEFKVNSWCSLVEDLLDGQAERSEYPKTMEEFDQGWGSMAYMVEIPKSDKPMRLHIENGHDYIQAFIAGVNGNDVIATLDRRMGDKDIVLPSGGESIRDYMSGGSSYSGTRTLVLLVEAMGRINFGRAIKDFKGIDGNVDLTYEDAKGEQQTVTLTDWNTWLIPDSYQFYKTHDFSMGHTAMLTQHTTYRGGYYKATFSIDKVGDTFLDLSTWGKGFVYVNGHNLGRFWNIGPQQTLYCPGCWLREGDNEILIFDIVGPEKTVVSGLDHPVIDQLRNAEPPIHRLPGETLDLSGATLIKSGSFAPGNGWQTVSFDHPVTTRYICLEALNAHDGKEYACIAELYLKDENGERLSREPWKIRYADSEDITTGNRAADKIYDLQESTFWSTVKGIPFPHHIVIDLGRPHTLTALDCLPRMESTTPGAIKDFNIYTLPH